MRRGWPCGVVLPLGAIALAISLAFGTAAAAASSGFSAQGSAKQVYVTGLAPHARASLLNRAGHVVATKRADSQGGLLFRDVRPGSGYRVRLVPHGAKSGPLTVHSNA